jgi:hypothetical protein
MAGDRLSSVYHPGRAELLIRLGVTQSRIEEIRHQMANEISEAMRKVHTVLPEVSAAVNEATEWISDLETWTTLNS